MNVACINISEVIFLFWRVIADCCYILETISRVVWLFIIFLVMYSYKSLTPSRYLLVLNDFFDCDLANFYISFNFGSMFLVWFDFCVGRLNTADCTFISLIRCMPMGAYRDPRNFLRNY